MSYDLYLGDVHKPNGVEIYFRLNISLSDSIKWRFSGIEIDGLGRDVVPYP